MDADSDELVEIPISAIEHFSYCPRQCALIHIEGIYEENLFTIKGSLAHERAHSGDDTPSRGIQTYRGIPLWSERYGLRGKADIVELRLEGPYPIEYKSGRHHGPHADLQLCAQALCLEEMLGVQIPRGAIYHHATRRRREVLLDSALRDQTLQAIAEIRAMLNRQRLPPAPNDSRCPNCSLINACIPAVVGESARLRGLQGALWYRYELEDADA